jgi:hypothetical protein
MFRVNVCVGVCTLLSGSEFRRCIVSTIRRRRKKVRKEYERKEEDGESSSDDYIFVVDDSVYDCLLKLDIFHSRHVLGKRGRIQQRKRDDTQKTGANKKKRGLRKKVRDYGRSLLSQRERGRGGITKKRIIPFHFSST